MRRSRIAVIGIAPLAAACATTKDAPVTLEKAFSEKFQVVTQPAPGVVKLQVAVVDAEAATPGLRSFSMVVPQARLLPTVGSMASGKQVFAGALQVETKLIDAATGQLLAAAIARGVGGDSIKTAASGRGATSRTRWTGSRAAPPATSTR